MNSREPQHVETAARRLGTAGESAVSEVDQWTYGHQDTDAWRGAAEIEAAFARQARFYRALLGGRLPADRNAVILDLPCGEGAMVWALRQFGYVNATGYDIDLGRLATGQKLGLPLHHGNVNDVLDGSAENSVDCILAMDFIEHLEKPQVVEFLSRALRANKPGGVFLARTPCANAPQGMSHVFNDFTHKWAATAGVLERLMTAAGYDHVDVFGEHPTRGMSKGWVRVPVFRVMTGAINLGLRAMGMSSYGIWSSSMWGIGVKPIKARVG